MTLNRRTDVQALASTAATTSAFARGEASSLGFSR